MIPLIQQRDFSVLSHLYQSRKRESPLSIINLKHTIMLRWTITFIILAIIAGVLGFGGIAAGAAGIAKVLFFIFIVLFLISLIRGKKVI